ncbi:hypothetical protein M441DRAFT_363869 [Trichoderma asperellum CBS 433.97]|uniref:Uncharacterized protein n=1 Tax=Trichoderma asperellum (strain ATCC 204424 / CBS 433.97 / NBRC 101777) TaxID=1042311 RepID=A0A2T3ZE25_TRIA4|nr:hypothetical protein M441DRAFT_363869 [Trichoderma asperellum CBS 433.97]PTB43040.1 hypothetical protein M441DRAFT_363869 [Trichoderma asperellum CBS 433.97]
MGAYALFYCVASLGAGLAGRLLSLSDCVSVLCAFPLPVFIHSAFSSLVPSPRLSLAVRAAGIGPMGLGMTAAKHLSGGPNLLCVSCYA